MIKNYGFSHDYPYTNFHEMNLDWLLAQMLELRSDMKNFVNQNTIKYADPIQWNITTQYEGNTVVIEPNSGNAYISTQPVPAGVAISNTDYWSVIGNFSVLYESIKESIAAADDGSNINATEARTEGQLLWLNSKLYKVLSDISVGALYITSGTGQNLQEVTIEELLNSETNARIESDNAIMSSILSITGNIENEINTINGSILNMAGNINRLFDFDLSLGINPDNYSGSDGEKIQAAYDDAVRITTSDPTKNALIIIAREYDLTGTTILLKNTVESHKYGAGGFVVFLGVGSGGFKSNTIAYPSDGNFMFKKDPALSGTTYRHKFINLRFTAPEPAHTSIGHPDPTTSDDSKKVSMHVSFLNTNSVAWTFVENCYFSNLCYAYDNVLSTNDNRVYVIGLFCSNNHYIYCSGVFRGGALNNALFFNHEEIGLCVTPFALTTNISTNVFIIRDSIIEYSYYYHFQLNGGESSKMLISGNYIEGAILAVLRSGSTEVHNLTIENNMISTAGAGTTASTQGLMVKQTAKTKININENLFEASAINTTSFISPSETPAGTANKCIGNYFNGGATGFQNIASAISTYFTVE